MFIDVETVNAILNINSKVKDLSKNVFLAVFIDENMNSSINLALGVFVDDVGCPLSDCRT